MELLNLAVTLYHAYGLYATSVAISHVIQPTQLCVASLAEGMMIATRCNEEIARSATAYATQTGTRCQQCQDTGSHEMSHQFCSILWMCYVRSDRLCGFSWCDKMYSIFDMV